jgi:Predicted carbamoyl transferase, NodU family
MNKTILSINIGSHDTSAAIMINGKLIAACEEERYSYIKHTHEFPQNAIEDCLKIAGINIHDIDVLIIPYDPHFCNT